MNFKIWIEKAKTKIDTLELGDEFLLKDLYDGVVWNNLSRGERLNFGKYFKNEVTEGNIPTIVYAGKAQNNSAMYRKE